MMRNGSRIAAIALLLAACDDGSTRDAADEALYAQGEMSFERLCASCHDARWRTHRTGPHLVAVEGRRAGSLKGFDYSPAMQAFGFMWDADAFDAFLADPRTTVPGTKMAIEPIAEPAERAAIFYYVTHQ